MERGGRWQVASITKESKRRASVRSGDVAVTITSLIVVIVRMINCSDMTTTTTTTTTAAAAAAA